MKRSCFCCIMWAGCAQLSSSIRWLCTVLCVNKNSSERFVWNECNILFKFFNVRIKIVKLWCICICAMRFAVNCIQCKYNGNIWNLFYGISVRLFVMFKTDFPICQDIFRNNSVLTFYLNYIHFTLIERKTNWFIISKNQASVVSYDCK